MTVIYMTVLVGGARDMTKLRIWWCVDSSASMYCHTVQPHIRGTLCAYVQMVPFIPLAFLSSAGRQAHLKAAMNSQKVFLK